MRFDARSIIALLCIVAGSVQAAEEAIVFTAAPTQSKQQTLQLYTPLMAFLSEATGKRFVIKPAANYVEYSVRMRMDKYDMLFDGPHMSGWRMAMLGHTPVARLPGKVRVAVVAAKSSRLNAMAQLANGDLRICSFASPHMLTMAFLSHFPDPMHQPGMIRIRGERELFRCLQTGRGDAMVVSLGMWNSLTETQKAGLKLVATPQQAYPNFTFTVSDRVSPELRKQITQALLSAGGQRASAQLLAAFGRDRFVAANAEEYAGLDALLAPVWGFHARN